MSKSAAIGPWQGVDNVHDEDDAVFQTGRRQPPFLKAAVNVDLRDDGWPVLRSGTTQRIVLTSPRQVHVGYDNVYVVANGEILLADTTVQPWVGTPVVTGLDVNAPVNFLDIADQTFWLTRFAKGRFLGDGTPAPWGLDSPTEPRLAPVVGTLCPGTYMVAVAYVDAFGVEHELSRVVESTVGDSECRGPGPATGFTIDMVDVPADVDAVRVYITMANGGELFYVADIAPADFPVSVTSGGNAPWSDTAPIGQFMRGPVPGDGLFAANGSIITFTDNVLYASLGPAHHLFSTNLATAARPTAIRAGGGVTDGFWTVTDHGAYWTAGSMPTEWRTDQKDARTYASGSFTVSGRFLPAVETDDEVVVFLSSEGAVAGKAGGSLVPLTQDRFHLDVKGKHATFCMRKYRGTRHLLWTLH